MITPVFNSPEALEVAEYWKSLVDAGIMGASEHSAAENKFLAGNLAFVVMSSNRMSRWTDVDINIGAIEMPYFKQQSVALGGNVLVIFTQDPQKIEAAWDFITYLLQPEQEPRLRALHRLPAGAPVGAAVGRGQCGDCAERDVRRCVQATLLRLGIRPL